jgi:hypothetical protein
VTSYLVDGEEFELISDGLPRGDDDRRVLVHHDRRRQVWVQVQRVFEEHTEKN